MSLYPSDPSAGSPFGTRRETFGTGPGYKRGAAISKLWLLKRFKPRCIDAITG